MAAAALSGVIGKRKRARQEALAYYFSISRWIVGLSFFTISSAMASLFLGFTKCFPGVGSKPPLWLGLENYQDLIDGETVGESLPVTAYYNTVPFISLESLPPSAWPSCWVTMCQASLSLIPSTICPRSSPVWRWRSPGSGSSHPNLA